MRSILESTVKPEQLARITPLVEQIYALHEDGRSYDHLCTELSDLVGSGVTVFDVCSAFGSVDPQSFAHDLLVRAIAIPNDLVHSEMLELVELLLEPKRGELRTAYWLACLTQNTGDPRFSNLIYWPGEYFHDGDNSRELSAEEIIRIAQTSGSSAGNATGQQQR